MENFSLEQRKVLANFFTIIAAGWFGAGVISTVFVRSENVFDVVSNTGMGLAFAYICLRFALFLSKEER